MRYRPDMMIAWRDDGRRFNPHVVSAGMWAKTGPPPFVLSG
jgi:hypothetical protein